MSMVGITWVGPILRDEQLRQLLLHLFTSNTSILTLRRMLRTYPCLSRLGHLMDILNLYID